MERAIYQNGLQKPNALAIIDGSCCLTYHELLAESAHLARNISQFGLVHEEPIGILLGVGIKQVVAQLAVLLAGCTCVPIEPSTPPLRITNMLQDINVKLIILEEGGQYASKKFEHVYIGDIGRKDALDCNVDLGLHQDVRRSHILFTSGSTGKPKPVQISAHSIVHLANKTPATPLFHSDRVAEFNNPGFDLSLFEIWVTLLSGATIVTIPKVIATDPVTLQSFLEEHKVTVLIITAALFEIIVSTSPSTFQTLRHVLTAGDIANKKAMRHVLESGPPQHLWNTYGPTECTTLATMFHVTLKDIDHDRVSIGKPVGEMQIFLLDDELKPVHGGGKRGEICIAGPQQTAGYLNRPCENEKRFIELSKSDLEIRNGDVETDSSAIRLYRTGDTGEWRPGCIDLDFVGRMDNQVKHGGFRVELEEIEKVFLDSGLVRLAVVIRRPSSSPSGTASLVAFVVPEDDREFSSAELYKSAQAKLPLYMLPNTIEAVTQFPMTHNGKVDRKALTEQSIESHQRKCEEMSCDASSTDRRSAIKSIYKDMLSVSHITDEDDFFALGASSLQAAKLIAMIKQDFGCLVTMRDLYENSRLSCLLTLLGTGKKPAGESDCTAEWAKKPDVPDDTAAWAKDIDLVDEIEDVPDWQADNEGRVFITGVTGFVGAFFLQHLLDNPGVKQIACLARSHSCLSAAQRIQKNMEQYDLWPPNFELPHKILVIEGDITDKKLGLGREQYSWLTNWASVIFHIAAKANYCEPYRGHYVDNVVGTRNMLCFAATGRRKSFHYMSSIDVWGPAGFFLGTRILREDDPLQPHAQGLRYALGYAQSQWTAEGMVRRMRDRGLPVIIYRPGFIVGHSKTGANNPNDFMSRLIASCIQLKAFPKLTQRLEYVTVDYVVEATMHIAASTKNLGSSYSLLSPKLATSVSVEETCSLLNQAGYESRLVDYRCWVNRVVETQLPGGPLAPLIPFFEEQVLGRLTRWEVSQYSPFYDSQNTVRALADSSVQYTPLNTKLLKSFVAFWNRKGFYDV